MLWLESGEPLPVEARDQARDGIARTPPGALGCRCVALSRGHCQQRFGSGDLRGGFGVGAADATEEFAFFFSEWSERVFLATRYGSSLLLRKSSSA
jgi:hypothetical protein